MPTRSDSPLVVLVKGAAAGLVGTAALTVVMRQGPTLMQRLGIGPSQPEGPKPQNGGEEAAEPTEKLAEKVAGGVLETSIEEDTRRAAGQAIRWSYGAAWGALYGIVQSSLHLPHLLHGTLFGGVVGVVASTLVPAMGLTPPPTQQPMAVNAMQIGFHLIYGWVTALTFRALSSDA
jgi:hypothetical protein